LLYDCSPEPFLDTLISLCSSPCSSSNIGCGDFTSTGGEFSEGKTNYNKITEQCQKIIDK